ncbi:hypothetical protein BJV74DRAFT_124810 [Russula compacta]|nr:hypothetical protein BJV74DRAFT_124810 [Russula compacta]
MGRSASCLPSLPALCSALLRAWPGAVNTVPRHAINDAWLIKMDHSMTMKPDPIDNDRLDKVGTRTIVRTYPVGVGVDRGSPGDVREGHVKVKVTKIAVSAPRRRSRVVRLFTLRSAEARAGQ